MCIVCCHEATLTQGFCRVGTIIGVSLIAALAFYGGRASQRRSINKHGIDTARSGQRPWYGKVLGRDRHGGHGDVQFASDMSFQPADDGSGLWADSNTQMQAQSTHSVWPKRKPLPDVTVDGIRSPYSADHTLGGDIGASTGGLIGPGHTWHNPGSHSMEYGGETRSILAEGQGFLQGQSRPVAEQ